MIFGLSFGSKKGATSTKSTEEAQTDIEKEAVSESTKTGETTTTGTTTQQVSQLDPETQAILQNLIASAGGVAEGADLTGIAQQLLARGEETEAVLGENIEAIIGEARRTGEKELGQLSTQLAAGAGSAQNTFVAGATAEARAALESSLAGQRGQLNIQAREAGGRDLLSAFQALATGSGQETANIASLVNALKGGTTTSAGETAQTTLSKEELATVEQISQAISQLTKGTSTGTSKQSGFSLGLNI
jgi:hypothetical protein